MLIDDEYCEWCSAAREVFRGRTDVIPKYWKNKDGTKSGYSPICRNEWKRSICQKLNQGSCRSCASTDYAELTDELLSRHFQGTDILGVYPLLPDETCHLVAADFDDHGTDDVPRDPYRDATEFHAACEIQGIPCYLERSKSGNGLHAWVVFDSAVPAWKARLVLFALLREAGVIGEDEELSSFDRLIPNQDAPTGKGFGNLIAMPFQGKAAELGHTLFLDPATDFREPYSAQLDVLKTIQRATEADLDRIIGAWELTRERSGRAGNTTAKRIDPSAVLSGVPEGQRDETIFRYACSIRSRGGTKEEALVLVRQAAQACDPTFPEHEADAKVESAWRYETERGKEDQGRVFSRQELLERIEATDDFDELTGQIARDITTSGLSEPSIHSLRKLIAKKTGVTLTSLKADAAKHSGANGAGDLPHMAVARAVIESYGEDNLVGETAFTWEWKQDVGVWRKIEDREIKQTIIRVADSPELTRSVVDSVLELVKTIVFRPGHRFDEDRRAINVLNGELHWTGLDWELRPHCRESYRTTQIPIAYKRSTEAPRFTQFLEEIFHDDEDRPAKIILVFEMIGYCLLSSCEFEKFFILYGPGANGKSVLMGIIADLVGLEHVCAVQPSQFENRFQRAHLHGKLVNLVTEIAEGHEIADAQLKAIVSGELTTAEHKHKPPFDFGPFATCIFGTNHLPHTRDFSDALFRRAIIIPFNRTFAEEEQDKHLKHSLREELQGILYLALSALAAVILRGQFTTPQSTQDLKNSWRLQCDQAAQFVQDKCKTGPGLSEISGKLFRIYKQWAQEEGIGKTLNHKNFTGRLQRLGFEPSKGAQGTRLIQGLELNGQVA